MAFLSKGDVLSGRYRIEELLGEGAFGRVYLAFDQKERIKVAVKAMKAGPRSGDARLRRFDREIQTLKRLGHPYILQYLDHGSHADIFYLVVELLEGRSLEEVGPDFHGQPEKVMLLGARLAEAFAAAHAQGVIHRDIKPGNIHLTHTGEPRILDYGLARWEMPEDASPEQFMTVESLTQTNALIGTIPYMSPEQLRTEKLDRRSDIFSLAVVLYELAGERRPYDGQTLRQIIDLVEAGRPPRLKSLNPKLDTEAGAALDTVLRRALHPFPQKRFQRMEEFGSALEKAMDLGSSIPKEASSAILLPPQPTLAKRELCILRGRDEPFGRLKEALDEAGLRGHSAFALVGPAGIGKSLLISEFAAHAHREGCLCLTAMVPRAEPEANVRPVVDWLTRAVEIFPSDAALRGALESFEPGGVSHAQTRDPDPVAVEERVVAALVGLASRMPLVLLMEDVHLATSRVLDVLSHLGHSSGKLGLLLGVSFRIRPTVAPASATAFARLVSIPDLRQIVLPPLETDDLRQIAEDLYPGLELPDPVLRQLVVQSEGNPGFARGILNLLEQRGALERKGSEWALLGTPVVPAPPEAREILEERLEGLSADDHEVFDAAAILGYRFGLEVLAGLLERDPEALRPLLRRLERERHLILRAETDYHFDQQLTREILLDRLSEERKGELNLRAAQILTAGGRDETEPRALGAAGLHFLAAGREEEALPCFIDAGMSLQAETAHDQAIPLLRHAEKLLEARIETLAESDREPPRVQLSELELALGYSLQSVARPAEALDHLEKARALALSLERRDIQARSLIWMSHALLTQGDMLQAERRARDAERLARRSALNIELGMALSAEANALSRSGDLYLAEAEQMWVEAAELLDSMNNREEAAEVHFRLGNHYFRLDRYDVAEERYAAAAERIDPDQNPRLHARIQNSRAAVHLALGQVEEALPIFEAAAATRKRIGARRGEATTLGNIAYCHHRLGKLDDARRIYTKVLEMSDDIGDTAGRSSAQRNLAEVLLDMGKIEEALADAGEALGVKRHLEDLSYLPHCLNLVGEIELQLGRADRARAVFNEVLRDFSEAPEETRIALAGLAQAEWLADDLEAARGRFDELARKLEERDSPVPEIQPRYRLMRFLRFRNAELDALEEIASPVLEARSNLTPEEGMHVELVRAVLAEVEGRQDDASAHGRIALGIAEKVGLAEHVWRIHRELARLEPEGSEAWTDHLRRALSTVEEQAKGFSQDELRSAYLSQRDRAELMALADRLL